MKYFVVMAFLLVAAVARGQDQDFNLDDVMDAAQDFARENLDDRVLNALQQVDRDKVKEFLAEFEKELQGDYVLDLAALKDTAKTIQPLLEQSPDTAPYAAWLRARIDYMEVADELRAAAPPAPKPPPGQPPKKLPNPTAQQQREVWIKRVTSADWPEAAKTYVPKLKPVFATQTVPVEFVWMAEVESAFNPRAKSPVGAAGLFQLMPPTAKQYGLRTMLPDQRLDAELSAAAASKYLKALQGQFKDWRLSLAAYNSGQGTVGKLLTKHNARSFDAISPYLPAETQMYVPRIEATILRRENRKLAELGAPAATKAK